MDPTCIQLECDATARVLLAIAATAVALSAVLLVAMIVRFRIAWRVSGRLIAAARAAEDADTGEARRISALAPPPSSSHPR